MSQWGDWQKLRAAGIENGDGRVSTYDVAVWRCPTCGERFEADGPVAADAFVVRIMEHAAAHEEAEAAASDVEVCHYTRVAREIKERHEREAETTASREEPK